MEHVPKTAFVIAFGLFLVTIYNKSEKRTETNMSETNVLEEEQIVSEEERTETNVPETNVLEEQIETKSETTSKYKSYIPIDFFPGGINNYISADGTWGNYQGSFTGIVPDHVYEKALRFVDRSDLIIEDKLCDSKDLKSAL